MDDDRQQRLQRLATALSQSRFTGGGFNIQERGQMTAPEPVKQDNGSFFGNFFRSIGSGAVALATGAPKVVGTIANDIWDAVNSTAESAVYGTMDLFGSDIVTKQMSDIQRQEQSLSQIQDMVMKNYQSGRITKSEYKEQLKNISESYNDLAKSTAAFSYETNVKRRVIDIVETGGLYLGLRGNIQVGGGLKFLGSSSKVVQSFGKTVTALESQAARIPALREIMTRSAPMGSKLVEKLTFSKLSGTALEEPVLNALTTFFIKQPLTVGQNIGEIDNLLKDLSDGDNLDAVGRAAWISSQLLSGGPLGASMRALKKAGITARTLTFGTESMYDMISKRLKDGDASSIARYLKNLSDNDPEKYTEVREALEVMQEVGLRKSGDDARMAAQFQIDWHTKEGVDMSLLSAEEYIERTVNLFKARQAVYEEALRGALKLPNGKVVPLHLASKVAVARFDRLAKKTLQNMVEEAHGQGGMKAVRELVQKLEDEGVSYMQNANVRDSLKALANEKNIKKLGQRIADIKPGTRLKVSSKLNLDDGYFAVLLDEAGEEFVKPSQARKLVSAFADELDDIDSAITPVPVAQTIGAGLRKMGLTPEDTTAANFYHLTRNLQENLVDIAGDLNLPINAQDSKIIINKLQRYANSKRELYDLRQMNLNELKEVLGMNQSQAKLIRNAINQSYLQVPLQIRGLGDRIVDYTYNTVPLFNKYSRTQSRLRYAYNPFFRWQEITETEILAQTLAGGKKVQYPGVNQIRGIFRRNQDQMDEMVQKIEDIGIFSSGFTGEATQDAVLGKITADMTRAQKESLAGLAERMAQKAGKSFDQYLAENYDEVADALRIVVQYPKQSVLNSSLARTINLAFFPTRYNAKVSMMAAKELAKLPPTLQFATLNSLYDMTEWFETDEGVAWRQEHAEAIGVFQWLTPIGSIQSVQKILTGDIDSISEIGLLGGLPFGLIAQSLDHQGVLQLGTPYVNPKTGEQMPDWIPKTAKARAEVALTDLLSSLFTYPGRTIGLPGKGQAVREVVGSFVDTSKEDYDVITDESQLTEKQINYINSLQSETNTVGNSFDGYKLPPGPLPAPSERLEETPLQEVPQKSSSGSSKKTARPIQAR